MELDVKKSKVLKISLLVLAVIILLSIGAAMGSHFGRNRGYGNNSYGCGGFDRFERNGRSNTMWNGRQDGRQFRMMIPQADNVNGQTQTQVPVATSTPDITPITK